RLLRPGRQARRGLLVVRAGLGAVEHADPERVRPDVAGRPRRQGDRRGDQGEARPDGRQLAQEHRPVSAPVATEAVPAAGTRRRRSALAREEMRDGYLMMLPWLVGFVVLLAGPMLYSLYMSFTNWQMLVPEVWIGLRNYQEMAGDELVRTSLGNT